MAIIKITAAKFMGKYLKKEVKPEKLDFSK